MTISKFIAPTINLASLPEPDAIEVLDVEAILAARMADFQVRADQAGFPYDVAAIETDPAVIMQEAGAFRETLLRSRINSSVRAVLPAFAQGADLDGIVARANVQRIVIQAATDDAPAVMESDAALRNRYLATYGRPAAGSTDAYTSRVLEVIPYIHDVLVAGPSLHGRDREALVYLLAPNGVMVTAAELDLARGALLPNDATPVTDVWDVVRATIVPYSVEVRIEIPTGPSPAAVTEASRVRIQEMADARYSIGSDVWRNAIGGAAYVSNVQRAVVVSPLNDVITNYNAAPFCTGISVTAEIV